MTYLWCIHGNLQKPVVWAKLQKELESSQLRFELEDISAALPEKTEGAFDVWARTLCGKVEALPEDKHVLLGYSLGGRLGFHALLECPHLWSGAIIVAADPGLNEAAKTKQVIFDQHWAKRWQTETWEVLWRDWNAQSVFAGRENLMQSAEAEVSRSEIAQIFDVFSKGRQADLRSQLAQLDAPPMLYVSGEDDSKYSALGRELAGLCRAMTHEIVEGAAHRVPWESPSAFTNLVKDFLIQIAV